jgi:hypothetical protein
MPAKSKSQFRFMKAVENGSIKVPGLSKEKAHEYTSENKSLKGLPEKKGKFKRLNGMMGK